jgi:hypothetical protein
VPQLPTCLCGFHFFCRFTGTARLWGRDEESVSCRFATHRDRSVKKWKVDRSAYASSVRCEPCSCYCSGICCVKLAFRQQFPRVFFVILLNRLRRRFRRRRKYECRYQGVEQPSISNAERRQTIYADQKGAHTHLADDAGNTMVTGDAKSLPTHKRTLIASITLVVVIAAGWLIRGSILYEPTTSIKSAARTSGWAASQSLSANACRLSTT